MELPDHVKHLRSLAPLVREIIVIDSESTDGTNEYLREALADLQVVFLEHPIGLYQSWNYAISKATQPYLTVATVGDPLTPPSLERLVQTIERFGSDVVISPPRLIGRNFEPVEKKWPVHDLIEAGGIVEATEISGLTWMVYMLFSMPSSLLSSSAGNLYRSDFLKQHPFPCEYGHSGDSVWSLQMSLKARWAIDPTVESYFWLHEQSAHKEHFNHAIVDRIRTTSHHILDQHRDQLRAMGLSESILEEASESIRSYGRASLLRHQYRQCRKSFLPWFLQPKAHKLRREKREDEKQRRKFKVILDDYTRQVAFR